MKRSCGADAASRAQVSARGGRPLIIANDNDTSIDDTRYSVIRVPQTIDCLQGILTIVPLQLLSYHLAVAKGCSAFLSPWTASLIPSNAVDWPADVDMPRNLAKS